MNFRIKLRSELVKRHVLVIEVPAHMKQFGKRLGQGLLLNPEPPMVSWTGVLVWSLGMGFPGEEEDTWDPGQKIKPSLVTVKKMDRFEVVIAQLLESGQERRMSTSQFSGGNSNYRIPVHKGLTGLPQKPQP